MKYISVVAFLAATVYGIGIGDLPECSQQCVKDAVKKAGCDEDGRTCFCPVITAYEDTYDCFLDKCGRVKTVTAVVPIVEEICDGL